MRSLEGVVGRYSTRLHRPSSPPDSRITHYGIASPRHLSHSAEAYSVPRHCAVLPLVVSTFLVVIGKRSIS
ncbi:uncharacterized protein EI97DRAFT_85440 [Westerdykella ornata]|uniref:Uncharacterized protein n=1 Tax=Westerdykella ornata TaxID=318751 RepID=A0A6A6JEP3_WESOR|nr:uncharacterized protein EI97DRAFT_85440 [Westerdykella ornata]KAF2275031.1 hypothetical protein EI97DRAFT_85440 [Westerdykella ornata]